MDTKTFDKFMRFWDRVSTAEVMIRDPAEREISLLVGDIVGEWLEIYEPLRPALKPFTCERPFIAPPDMPDLAVFPAETAHQALMILLNPPTRLFELPNLLGTPEYLEIRREALEEFCQLHAGVRPRWNSETREFRYGRLLCKAFRQQAKNQIAILARFEENGWPERISDPLGDDPGNATREKTRDAIRNLNHNDFIKFQLAGDKDGILWETK